MLSQRRVLEVGGRWKVSDWLFSLSRTFTLFSPSSIQFNTPTTTHTHNGRRRREIPASQPQVVAPTGSAAQLGDLVIRERIYHNDMGQGERDTTLSRQVDHAGQEEHRSEPETSTGDFLRMSLLPYLRPELSPSQLTDMALTPLETTSNRPQTLRRVTRTLRHPARRIHARSAHRAAQSIRILQEAQGRQEPAGSEAGGSG